IHTSGHGNIEELIWMNQKVNAKYFMPAYGYHSMLRNHAQSVIDKGRDPKSVIIPDNGNVIEIDSSGEMTVLKEKVAHNILAVDGFRVGEIQDVVIRDRKTLTKDGIFVVVITLDLQSGEIRKSLDIISRGFIYLRDNQELMQEARKVIKTAVMKYSKGAHPISFDEVKASVSDEAARFLLNKTGKRPIIIPVILGM
ncbi:MAG: ribonuclease J, partial [bacterium]|nr:ribonuclease J [bacterium]